jgi:heme-degrading monooxygenase HmoA
MYAWEFEVAPEHQAAFVRAYGPDGDWVRLFRRAPGYVRTELLRDLARPARFVTLDHWESPEAFAAFRARYAAEFEAIDARCQALTLSEREIGRFEPAR